MRVIACPINTHFLFLSSFWHEVQKRVQPTILRPNLTFHNPHGQWIGCTPIMFTILLLSKSQMSTAFGGSCCLRGGESIFFSLFWNLWHQCEWVECRLHRCTTHAGGIWRAPVANASRRFTSEFKPFYCRPATLLSFEIDERPSCPLLHQVRSINSSTSVLQPFIAWSPFWQ